MSVTGPAPNIVQGQAANPRIELEKQRQRLADTASGSQNSNLGVLKHRKWHRISGSPL